MSADGVERYFAEFHHSTLQAASFGAEWTKIDTDQSEIRWRKRYESDGAHAVGRATSRPAGGPVDVYRSSADGGLWREDVGSEYVYGVDYRGPKPSIVAWGNEVVPILKTGQWSAPERANDGRPAVWEVTADGFSDGSVVPGHLFGEMVSLSASMQVDERGFVSQLDADYSVREPDGDGGIVRTFTSTFSVDAVRETTVSEPDWAADAREERPRMSAELLDGGSYVRLSHEGGSPILSNSILSVYDDAAGSTYDLSLDSPIRPEETVYVYPADRTSAFPSMGLSRGSRPGTDPSLAFEDPIDTWARRADLQYYKVRF